MSTLKVKKDTGTKTCTGKEHWTASALATVIKLNNIIGFLPVDIDRL